MSNFKKKDWCKIFDNLFYNFVNKHKKILSKNYSTSIFVKFWNKKSKKEQNEIKKENSKTHPNPTGVNVGDEGHLGFGVKGGAGFTGETHYRLTLISPQFTGLSRIDRQRLVNDLLAEEFKIIEPFTDLYSIDINKANLNETQRNIYSNIKKSFRNNSKLSLCLYLLKLKMVTLFHFKIVSHYKIDF